MASSGVAGIPHQGQYGSLLFAPGAVLARLELLADCTPHRIAPHRHPAGINNLQSLLKRLEASVTRLEDVALAQAQAGGMQHVVSGADAVSAASVASPPPPPPKPADKPAPAVEAFQEIIDGPLTKYVDLSKEVGGLVAEQVRLGPPSSRNPPPTPC